MLYSLTTTFEVYMVYTYCFENFKILILITSTEKTNPVSITQMGGNTHK